MLHVSCLCLENRVVKGSLFLRFGDWHIVDADEWVYVMNVLLCWCV